ncbi:ABC transporter permease [Patescibacteria group bacterium]|nr:ABC transporter permease [Patescibacteria group bacterium]
MKETLQKTENLREVVYTPESQLRRPRQLFKSMWHDLLASRGLAWRLIVRDISAQYRQSIFGILWAFIPPIVTALVFVVLNNQKIINIGETNIPYPAFVMFGTVLWQVFIDSLNAPLKAVTAGKAMLAKINFPKEALILSGIGQTLFNLCIKLLILIVVFIIYKIPLSWGVPLSLLAILNLVLLGITFGLLITPIGILYTDIIQGITVITGFWFFITPVVYPPPTNFPFSLLAILNPVSPILVGARDLATQNFLPNPIAFFIITGLMLFTLCVVWIVYRLAIPILVERMSA